MGNLSPKLSPNIMPNDPSNLVLKSDDCKLLKTKKNAKLTSRGLGNSSYDVDQSVNTLFGDSLAVYENNTDNMNNF